MSIDVNNMTLEEVIKELDNPRFVSKHKRLGFKDDTFCLMVFLDENGNLVNKINQNTSSYSTQEISMSLIKLPKEYNAELKKEMVKRELKK
jgi:hypothetical protein